MEVDFDDWVVYLDYGGNIGEDDKAGGDDDDRVTLLEFNIQPSIEVGGWSNNSTKFDDDSIDTNNSQVFLDRNGLWREHPLHSEEGCKEVLLRRANARVRII